jgi:hypothetical protein
MMRKTAIIVMLAFVIAAASIALAQYQNPAIPNFAGIGTWWWRARLASAVPDMHEREVI